MFSIFKKKTSGVTDINWLEVDIHNHLLPGIDDGSKELSESLGYIDRLGKLGFSRLICTPHIFQELYPNTRETILPALESLKADLLLCKSDMIVDAAAEYMVDHDFKVSNDLMVLPGKYILIEMSYLNETPNFEQYLFDLQVSGYKLILAHPERYIFYHQQTHRYQRLKDLGCLFQLNLLSVTGYYNKAVKEASSYLLKNKFYDLAGTDLHHGRHLSTLEDSVRSGRLFNSIGNYDFKNKWLFGNKNY